MATDTCDTCRFWQALNPNGQGFSADRNYRVDEDGDGILMLVATDGETFGIDLETRH